MLGHVENPWFPEDNRLQMVDVPHRTVNLPQASGSVSLGEIILIVPMPTSVLV